MSKAKTNAPKKPIKYITSSVATRKYLKVIMFSRLMVECLFKKQTHTIFLYLPMHRLFTNVGRGLNCRTLSQSFDGSGCDTATPKELERGGGYFTH